MIQLKSCIIHLFKDKLAVTLFLYGEVKASLCSIISGSEDDQMEKALLFLSVLLAMRLGWFLGSVAYSSSEQESGLTYSKSFVKFMQTTT